MISPDSIFYLQTKDVISDDFFSASVAMAFHSLCEVMTAYGINKALQSSPAVNLSDMGGRHPQVCLLKIDTEGAELRVLRSAEVVRWQIRGHDPVIDAQLIRLMHGTGMAEKAANRHGVLRVEVMVFDNFAVKSHKFQFRPLQSISRGEEMLLFPCHCRCCSVPGSL